MAIDVTSAADEGAFHALWRSFAMIIVSEIGDKTFLIAAILAMRHPRLVVFAGAFGSLVDSLERLSQHGASVILNKTVRGSNEKQSTHSQ